MIYADDHAERRRREGFEQGIRFGQRGNDRSIAGEHAVQWLDAVLQAALGGVGQHGGNAVDRISDVAKGYDLCYTTCGMAQ